MNAMKMCVYNVVVFFVYTMDGANVDPLDDV